MQLGTHLTIPKLQSRAVPGGGRGALRGRVTPLWQAHCPLPVLFGQAPGASADLALHFSREEFQILELPFPSHSPPPTFLCPDLEYLMS